jgi:hypothetical protein
MSVSLKRQFAELRWFATEVERASGHLGVHVYPVGLHLVE